MTHEEEAARDAAYINCMEVAKSEIDSLQPTLDKLQERVRNLKRAVMSLGNLTNRPVDDKYSLIPPPERASHQGGNTFRQSSPA